MRRILLFRRSERLTTRTINIVKTALDGLDKKTGQVIGQPANVTPEMPAWLQNTLNLDTVIQNLRDVAIASNGYYKAGQTPANFGDVNNATGITFVDGDVALSQSGGGIFVCTGTLTYNGGVDFNGLIIVTGAGGFYRNGGGNGTIQGNAVVAPYNPTNLAAGFLSPKYDISGGGNSKHKIQFEQCRQRFDCGQQLRTRRCGKVINFQTWNEAV